MHQAKSDETIFSEALNLPPEERTWYLHQVTIGDQEQRQRIESLLNGYEAVDFLEQAAAPELQSGTATVPLTEGPGDKIGRYKLLQQIGEGGCGVVYMAEQEEPVRRRVALKVIKLGMDTKSVVARFEAERQAVALMDHPNIAKVLDAGATDTGRPYFVMELVRGTKITEYCDHNNLTTNDRLALFLQVCMAVQHAHQKGIIHRDLKPSNILVTLHDGVAVPKVIDFGIAKATQGRLTDKTVFTAFEQMIGTPAYMSPEQAEMSGLDIDTRSDIYSLGVLLYELLTGRTPFDAEELLRAGLDAMCRTIREQEPLRPSTRLSTMVKGELTITANRRQTEPPKLLNAVRGDLDWIAMKCLEKDRARRYETANGLANDLKHFLDNEPVLARPPSNLYRLRKTIRRNKLAFAGITAGACALLIGFGISTWMLIGEIEAKHQQARLRQEAQTEAAKSQEVAQFLKDMLKSVRPSVALGRDTKLMRAVLDETAGRIGKDLARQPAVEAELRSICGEVYWAIGEFAKAETMHREALAIRRKLLGNHHLLVADSLSDLAVVLRSERKLTEAESIQREALDMQTNLFGYEHPKVATSIANLASVLDDQEKHIEAECLSRDALALCRKLFGNESPEVATAFGNLAVILDNAGKLADAENIQRDALALQRRLFGDIHPNVAATLYNLGTLLMSQRKLTEAEPFYRDALSIQERVLGNDHPDFATTLHYLGRLLERQDRMAEAEPLFRQALLIRKKVLGDEHPAVASSLKYLAMLLLRQKRYDEAEKLFADVPASSDENGQFLVVRAYFRGRRGRFAEAAADLTRAIGLKPEDHLVWHMLACVLVETSGIDTYREHCRKSLERFAKAADPEMAHRIAKDCLILPSSGVDLRIVVRLADAALAVGTNHMSWPIFALTKSLAEYRQGNFIGAVDWSEKILSCRHQFEDKPWVDVETYTVLAMARLQLKQIDSGHLALTMGQKIADTRLPELESGDLEDGWLDWIIAQALLREAGQLIEDKAG